jgi:hypothetical protein
VTERFSYFKDFNKVLVNFFILMDKGAKNKLAGSPGENGGGQDAQKDLHSRTGRDKTKGKTQERMERKRCSGAGSENMERVGDR